VRRSALGLAIVALGGACPGESGTPPRYNLPSIGAPALQPPARLAAGDGGGDPRVIEEQLPEEATRHFRKLKQMERSPRWAPFARIIRDQTADLYRRAGRAKPRIPHDISVTQYFIRRLPEIYGVDFVAWCGVDYGGPLSYAESNLLIARIKDKYKVLAVHRPSCGSVGDRTVSFVDLLGDGTAELIERYVEDTAVGDDFQEIRVFTRRPEGLKRVAELRVSSPVKFFHVEFRHARGSERDIVTTHIELEKALGRLRARPCWMYRYFEVETVYRYDPKSEQFVSAGSSRRRLSPNVALDLTGGEVPEGSCEG
jgi:hypothetical protein